MSGPLTYEQFTERFPENTEIGRHVTDEEMIVYRGNGREVGAWRRNRNTQAARGAVLRPEEASALRQRLTVQPQDRESGLVERNWVRTSRKGGTLTERSLEGEHVAASFLDRHGHLQRAEGRVVRTEAGELAIESQADGVRRQTPVPRDASVDRSR